MCLKALTLEKGRRAVRHRDQGKSMIGPQNRIEPEPAVCPSNTNIQRVQSASCLQMHCRLWSPATVHVALFQTVQGDTVNSLRARVLSTLLTRREPELWTTQEVLYNWIKPESKYLPWITVAEFNISPWQSQSPEWKKKYHKALRAPSSLQRRDMGLGFLEELPFTVENDEWWGFRQIR